MLYELKPIYDSRKSFYSKAKVTDCGYWDNKPLKQDGILRLISYTSIVCYIENGKVQLLPCWDCSPTTLRHTKEFLKQNGFRADSKKQMLKDYAH